MVKEASTLIMSITPTLPYNAGEGDGYIHTQKSLLNDSRVLQQNTTYNANLKTLMPPQMKKLFFFSSYG